MEALIQHIFFSGVGDFIADFSTYFDLAHALKSKGYKVHLRLVLHKNKYVNKLFLKEIFTRDTLNVFDTIEENVDSIYDKKYNNFKYFESLHDPQEPGIHHIDVFYTEIPDNIAIKSKAYNSDKVYHTDIIPMLPLTFNDNIINTANEFNKKYTTPFHFLHVRTRDDCRRNNNELDVLINNVHKHLEQTNDVLHIGTNNEYIHKNLKKLKNIITFDYKVHDKIWNQLNTSVVNSNNTSSEDILLQRLIDTLAEMVSIQSREKIYIVSDYNWTSNFLFYPLYSSVISNSKIRLVDKKHWLPRVNY